MKKLICLIIIDIIIISTLTAQNLETSNSIKSGFFKNSIYVENLVILPSINYDRFIPLDNKIGIVLKVGLSFYSEPFLVSEEFHKILTHSGVVNSCFLRLTKYHSLKPET